MLETLIVLWSGMKILFKIIKKVFIYKKYTYLYRVNHLKKNYELQKALRKFWIYCETKICISKFKKNKYLIFDLKK